MSERGSDILAFTCTYHDRAFVGETVDAMRATAGCWFDWLVCAGAPSERSTAALKQQLEREDHLGIQYLKLWPENRGQHHATAEALKLARERKYKWLLRLDDDVQPKTKRWLSKMVSRLDEIKALTGDEFYRLVAGPKVVGLKNPIAADGILEKGQYFPVEVVPLLGGVCRLHPVALLDDYVPDLYAPLGRKDPERLATYLEAKTLGGMQIRFPDIRVLHRTTELESGETPHAAHLRRMSHYWPWLGGGM